jgi:hypothetical protein
MLGLVLAAPIAAGYWFLLLVGGVRRLHYWALLPTFTSPPRLDKTILSATASRSTFLSARFQSVTRHISC